MTEEQKDQGTERRAIRVAVRVEDLEDVRAQGRGGFAGFAPEGTDDVEGQAFRVKLGQTEADVEGQVYVMSVHRKGDPDDTEGQGARFSWLEPVGADDTKGQGYRLSIRPADPDEVKGQGYKYGGLKPEADGTWSVELDDDDTVGQGRGGFNG